MPNPPPGFVLDDDGEPIVPLSADGRMIVDVHGDLPPTIPPPPPGFVLDDVDSTDQPSAEVLARKNLYDKVDGPAGAMDLVMQGGTLGLSDEGSGLAGAIHNIISSPFTDESFNPVGAYTRERDVERLRLDDARKSLGGWGTALEIGGGLLSGNPTNALAAAPTLLGRMGLGARAGAAGGALAGYGYGEGGTGSALGAAGGAALGVGVGAAIPIAGTVVGNRVSGLQRMVGRDPTLPRRIVGEAIEADANTPVMAGRMMQEAQGRGVPAMLADTGENTRGLLASVTRQPGASRTVGLGALTDRQREQGNRLVSAIQRDLGPSANPHEVADQLMETARTGAAPLYDAAYAREGAGAFYDRVSGLFQRPSMQRALQRAQRLAAEEGEDPTTLGFTLDDAGEVVLQRVPSWKTLDYVKRGMDDVVETYRDKASGRLVLDTEGRAINGTLRTFLSRMDTANPDYAAARGVYAGPLRGRAAMEKGLKALGKNADDISAQTRDMTPFELELYRLGVRRAMVDQIAAKPHLADRVNTLIGSQKKEAVLRRLFGNGAEFDRFLRTLQDEGAAQLTYNRAATGSPTALNQAVDATTNDTGLAESAVDAALRGGKDGMWSALVAGLQRLREVERFGAGQAGERARESVAALLTETDPAVLRDLIAAAQAAAVRQGITTLNRSQRAARLGQSAGQLSGGTIGSMSKQRAQ